MSLTPSKRFVNAKTVGFTPAGGSLTSITGVRNVQCNPQATDIKGSGDGDLYNTAAGVVAIDYMVTVDTQHAALLNAVPPGTYGTLVWTTPDAYNGTATGGGGLTYTLVNAYFMGPNLTHPHRDFATASFVFHSYSSDGTTSPLSVSAL